MSVFRVFENKSHVPGTVDPWDQLHMMTQAVVGEFLQLLRRPGVRLDESRRALELKVAFEFESNGVDLEEGGLADDSFEGVDSFEMMCIVPEDQSQLQIGPIGDFSFRQA